MRQLPEWKSPTPEQFRSEIVPNAQPAVLRNVVDGWPLVRAAKQDSNRGMAMLSAQATDAPVEILRADPEEQGRFHYAPDGQSLNFIRGRASLPVFLAALREQEAASETLFPGRPRAACRALCPRFCRCASNAAGPGIGRAPAVDRQCGKSRDAQ